MRHSPKRLTATCLRCKKEFTYLLSKSLGKFCTRMCNDLYKQSKAESEMTYYRRVKEGLVGRIPHSHNSRDRREFIQRALANGITAADRRYEQLG